MGGRVLVLIAAASAAGIVLASSSPAAAAPHRWDLVTYSPPPGFTVDESARDHALVSRVAARSYCLIGIYTGAPAHDDLDHSFAAEWQDVVAHQIGPVAAPTPTHAAIGGANAAVGGAMGAIGGKPVLAVLTTIDAGEKVVSILVFTPNANDFKIYTPSIQALLRTVVVHRVEPSAPPPSPPRTAAPAQPASAGPNKVPPPARPLTVADLVGEWQHSTSAITSYASVVTGNYAGYSSVQFDESWTITARGALSTTFHGAHAGIGGTRVVDEKHLGTITVGADGDLHVQPKGAAGAHYLIRGWLVGPKATILKINGPWYDGIPDDVRRDPNKGYNLDEYWIRKAPAPKPH